MIPPVFTYLGVDAAFWWVSPKGITLSLLEADLPHDAAIQLAVWIVDSRHSEETMQAASQLSPHPPA